MDSSQKLLLSNSKTATSSIAADSSGNINNVSMLFDSIGVLSTDDNDGGQNSNDIITTSFKDIEQTNNSDSNAATVECVDNVKDTTSTFSGLFIIMILLTFIHS